MISETWKCASTRHNLFTATCVREKCELPRNMHVKLVKNMFLGKLITHSQIACTDEWGESMYQKSTLKICRLQIYELFKYKVVIATFVLIKRGTSWQSFNFTHKCRYVFFLPSFTSFLLHYRFSPLGLLPSQSVPPSPDDAFLEQSLVPASPYKGAQGLQAWVWNSNTSMTNRSVHGSAGKLLLGVGIEQHQTLAVMNFDDRLINDSK